MKTKNKKKTKPVAKAVVADFHVVAEALKEYFSFLNYTTKIEGEFYLSDIVSRHLKTQEWTWSITAESIIYHMTQLVEHTNRSIFVEEAQEEYMDFYISIKADNNNTSFGYAPTGE